MANWYGYFGVENLGLNEDQRETLIQVLRNLGEADNSPFPNLRMRIRLRLNRQAAIFEAVFDEDNLTVNQFKTWLANIFNIDPDTIDHTLTQTPYGPMVTFSRPSTTPRLRMLLFGGVGVDWDDSNRATVAYLLANIEGWETSD